MDFWGFVPAMLWASFVASWVAASAGCYLTVLRGRAAGLVLLLLSTVVLLAFSFLAGFSIGRFTAAIPVLLIGLTLGLGHRPPILLVFLVAAALAYLACSWLLTPLDFQAGVIGWALSAWAIPLYGVAAAVAFGIAMTVGRPGDGRRGMERIT